MRDIKFRGIPIKKEDRDKFGYEVGKPIDKFIYGDLEIDYNYGGGTKYYISMEVFGAFTYRDRIQVIPETIGQFTGLKDKNGKEIYEGDKLKVINHSILIGNTTSNMSYETRVYEIVFHDYAFMGKLIEYGIPHLKIVENYDPIYHDLIGMMDDIEVIGNIHDKGEVK